MCKDKNETIFWLAVMFNPSGIQTHILWDTAHYTTVPKWCRQAAVRERGVDELLRVPCSLSLSDVSLLSEDPCVVASLLFCIYISFSE